MPERANLLQHLYREIDARVGGDRVLRVGIDGVDGAGKTTLADELAERVSFPAIRASVDSFHHPRAVRHARGRDSPEGFYRDSFDLETLMRELLDPLSPGGSGTYRTAVFDHVSDRPVASEPGVVLPPAVLLFDGIFLHRPELRGYWDYSIFLDVDSDESVRRCVARSGRSDVSLDPADPVHRRYVQGQALYLAECRPMECAAIVVDNRDVAAPFIAA